MGWIFLVLGYLAAIHGTQFTAIVCFGIAMSIFLVDVAKDIFK